MQKTELAQSWRRSLYYELTYFRRLMAKATASNMIKHIGAGPAQAAWERIVAVDDNRRPVVTQLGAMYLSFSSQ
jgi:hypothetical protein